MQPSSEVASILKSPRWDETREAIAEVAEETLLDGDGVFDNIDIDGYGDVGMPDKDEPQMNQGAVDLLSLAATVLANFESRSNRLARFPVAKRLHIVAAVIYDREILARFHMHGIFKQASLRPAVSRYKRLTQFP